MNTTRKGTRFTKQVEDWLRTIGFKTTRRGWMDAGDDIVADTEELSLSIEAKSHNKFAMSEFIDQATANAQHWQIPVVVAKRRGRAQVEEAFVVMKASDFARMVNHSV